MTVTKFCCLSPVGKLCRERRFLGIDDARFRTVVDDLPIIPLSSTWGYLYRHRLAKTGQGRFVTVQLGSDQTCL